MLVSQRGVHDKAIELARAELSVLAVAVSAHLEVALFAPLGPPRVLDQPVIVTAFPVALAIANNRDGVVHLTLVWVGAMLITVIRHQDP